MVKLTLAALLDITSIGCAEIEKRGFSHDHLLAGFPAGGPRFRPLLAKAHQIS